MRTRFPGLAAAAAFLLLAAQARADEIIFKSGVIVEGIVDESEEDPVKIQVDLTGFVYYPLQSVLKIEKGSEKENAALLKKWQKTAEDASAKEAAAEADSPGDEVFQSTAPGTTFPCVYPNRTHNEWLTPEACKKEKETEAPLAKARAVKAETKVFEPAINSLPDLPGPKNFILPR